MNDQTGAGQETEGNSFGPSPNSEPDVAASAGATRKAQRALRVLLKPRQASRAALRRQVFDPQLTFEHMALCTDDFIATVAQGDGGGLEHRLYVAATDGLTDEEYLARIDVSSAATEATELI